jgi:hypothetical protein
MFRPDCVGRIHPERFSKLKADAAERTIPRLRRRIGRFAATLHRPRCFQLLQTRRPRVKSIGICSSYGR